MEFKKVLETRRSIRQYNGEEVTHAELVELIRAAQFAPSWKNTQTARFYVAESAEATEKVANALPEFNRVRTKGVGAYIVVTAVHGMSGFTDEGTPATHLGEGFQYFDNGLAVQNLCLAAKDMDLSTLIMGLYDEAALREIFDIPKEEKITVVLAVGKTDSDPKMNPRKETEEIVKFL